MLLAQLVADIGSRIWWAIRPYARDDDHCDDLHQDCWHAILERLHRYGGRGSFANWAITVSKNLCRMRLRKAKRSGHETALEDAGAVHDSAPDPEEELILSERRTILRRALGELPDRERDAIVLRVLEGRATAEIAQLMGVSRSVARSLVERGISRLRRMEPIRQLVMDWKA